MADSNLKTNLAPLGALTLGVLVFITSLILITGGCGLSPRFHEVKWDNRTIINELIDQGLQQADTMSAYAQLQADAIWQTDSLATEISAHRKRDTQITAMKKVTANLDSVHTQLRRKNTPSLQYPLRRKFLVDSIAASTRNKQKLTLLALREQVNTLNDSALFVTVIRGNVHIEDDSFDISKLHEDAKNEELFNRLRIVYRDAKLPSKYISILYQFPKHSYADVDVFMSAYPGFGLWSLLMVMQITLYVMCIFLLGYMLLYKTDYPSLTTRWIYILVIAVACILFSWNLVYSDKAQLIRPELFMMNLGKVFRWVNSFGYVAGALALSGMIFAGLKADHKRKAITDSLDDAAKKQLLAEIGVINKKFEFNFLIVAAILSFGVLTTGVFFSSLNELEFVRQYSRSMGTTIFKYDYVVLYGVVHTFLLVCVFLPIRMKISSLVATAKDAGVGTTEEGSSKTLSLFGAPLKKMFELLVASSPLIAGVLQSLLDMIFG